MSDGRDLRADAGAAVPRAVAGVPDGMAAAVLVGVNPVFGLYAAIAGPIAGGLTAATQRMVVTTTTAAALAAGSAVAGFSGDRRAEALFALTLLAGAVMALAGLLRLGRHVRLVSVSVLTGFLTGVAVNIVCGQLGKLLGIPASGSFALEKAWDAAGNLGEVTWAPAAAGLGALAILIVLGRTRFATAGAAVAILVPTLLSLGSPAVERVDDVGEIPAGLPAPHVPDLSLLVDRSVLIGALTVVVIVLVQGVGVAESAPNADGAPAPTDRDFLAQGAANLLAGLFQGQPVGGSVGQTALNLQAGARTRWAAVLSGVLIAVIVLALSGLIGEVAMPTLAAVLVYAAARSINRGRIETVLRTGAASRVAFSATLLATLVLPIAAAVGIGVALSLLLQLNREAVDLRVVRLVPAGGERFVEEAAPARLPGGEVVVLDVYGSLQFAGARTLQERLPAVDDARRPVVVLRLRGRTTLGATSQIVLDDYARRLAAAGGRLYLSGVAPELAEQLRRTQRVDVRGAVTVVAAEPAIGDATRTAHAAAAAWLEEVGP